MASLSLVVKLTDNLGSFSEPNPPPPDPAAGD
jgi:hypothetical protein